MIILVDQNVPRAVAQWLKLERPGWEVWHVTDVGLSGRPDSAIYEWAREKKAVVITYDEDFADARLYPLGKHPGVVRLRVWPTTIEASKAALKRLLATVPEDALAGSLVIVHHNRIRIRKRPLG